MFVRGLGCGGHRGQSQHRHTQIKKTEQAKQVIIEFSFMWIYRFGSHNVVWIILDLWRHTDTLVH